MELKYFGSQDVINNYLREIIEQFSININQEPNNQWKYIHSVNMNNISNSVGQESVHVDVDEWA